MVEWSAETQGSTMGSTLGWGPLSVLEACLAGGAGCHLGCSFSGQGESGREDTHHWSCAQAWRGYRVMPHTHTLTQNHYLKGVANQIASQSADQPCRSRHLSWRINSQSRGALGLYLVQVQTVSTCVCTQRTSLGWLNTPLVQRQNDKPQMMSEQV